MAPFEDAGADARRGTELERRLAAGAVRSERTLRRRQPVLWWSTLLGPFLLTLFVLAVLVVTRGGAHVQALVATAAATFFFFGKFVILGGTADGVSRFFSREELFALVVYMDAMTALLLVFHVGALFRLPWLGGKLASLVEDGRFILRTNSWMKRATFLGMVAFVTFPLASTGAVGGAIFGRLLGMTRRAALAAILIGSVLGGGVMYFGAGLVSRFVDRDSPLVVIGGVLFVAALLLLLNLRYRRMKASQRRAPGNGLDDAGGG